MNIIVLCASFLPAFASLALAGEMISLTLPEKTIRFPGGNYGHVAVSNGLAVTCSGWSREDTAAVFDVSDSAAIKFIARFPAKGYSCAAPVFFGTRCYVPNGFSASVIDLTDRARPKLEGYLNPQFPQNGCEELWTTNGVLYFRVGKQAYQVEADGFSFSEADVPLPPKKKNGKDAGSVSLRDNAVCTEGDTSPFVYNLASIAADGDTAWIYAPAKVSDLLTLDVSATGLRRFGKTLKMAKIERTYTTMGMQTASCIEKQGSLLFADDGIVKINRDGSLSILRDRTAAASNMSFDAPRVAIAQCDRCRILDYSDLTAISVLDITPKTELPIHITGCSLSGNRLFLAYTLVEEKGQDFIYKFPQKGYVASIDLTAPEEPLCTLPIMPCVALERTGDYLYVTGRSGKFAIIDASQPANLRLLEIRDDLLDGDGYKIKSFNGRVFFLNGHRVGELDIADPRHPLVKHTYERGKGTHAPSYDDFTVSGNRLYAVAHASVDVFLLDDPDRSASVPNDFGTRGMAPHLLEPADAAVFNGHTPAAKPADTLRFHAGYFGNYFGAYVSDFVKLPDGRYAVAYGEGSLVFCDEQGNFLSELPRVKDSYIPVFAKEVLSRGNLLYVKDGDGKVWQIDPTERTGHPDPLF